MTKILLFAGSARKESVNKKLIVVTADIIKEQGAQPTVIDLADYPMPLYDGDCEEQQGIPDNAQKLYDLINDHDVLMIASPEYNGLPSPLLKNTIDWISRIDTKVFKNKTTAIMAASPGGLGGLRGLSHLRVLLSNIGALVIANQMAFGAAFGLFNEDGSFKDQDNKEKIQSLIQDILAIGH